MLGKTKKQIKKNAPINFASPGADIAKFIEKLDQSQWWNPRQIDNYQNGMLKKLFFHCCRHVPFYRQQFEEFSIVPEQLSVKTWQTLPLLKREVLQKNKIQSRQVPVNHGKAFTVHTSGSSGKPVKIEKTQLTGFLWQALTIREHLWHRRNFSGKLAVIRAFPSRFPKQGITASNWGRPTSFLYRTGPAAAIDIRTTVSRQFEWLVRFNPDYLLTYPSNLSALIELSKNKGVTLENLKEVRTIGETVTPQLRLLCNKEWNVPIHDTYTSQEIGYIAIQCPEYDHYHIQVENAFVEIVNDQGNHCMPGETGRIVITELRNYLTPLIRYDINDYAEAGEICPCGRSLPVIKRIIGRQRNMLVLPSGEKRWPTFGFARYDEVAPIRQYQFIQHSLNQIEMRYACDTKLNKTDETHLKEIIMESLGYPFDIQLTPMIYIPKGPGGKFEDFISKLTGKP